MNETPEGENAIPFKTSIPIMKPMDGKQLILHWDQLNVADTHPHTQVLNFPNIVNMCHIPRCSTHPAK